MTEKIDIIDAQESAAETYSDLDTFRFVGKTHGETLTDTVELLVDVVTEDLYEDEAQEIQLAALEALVYADKIQKKIDWIRGQVISRVQV